MRNGGGATRNLQNSKNKSSNPINMSQRSLQHLKQAAYGKQQQSQQISLKDTPCKHKSP